MAHAINEAAHHTANGMDISEQSKTFRAFLGAAMWACTLIAMLLSLLVVAFALNLGWFAGLGAFVAVGVGAGLFLRLGMAFWVTLIASAGLLGLGGGVIALVF